MKKCLIFFTAFLHIAVISNLACASSSLPKISAESAWQEIFPSGTSIGEKDTSIPIWPIYQVGNLIGYVFESIDFVKIAGFSGEPVNLLIGIDIEGNFMDVRLVSHNEPIFLHGLGEQPLLDFIAQYEKLSAVDTIKVGDQKTGSITYIDGITKATVSVVVINETVLLSALKVARDKLEGFEAAPIATPNLEHYSPVTWDELIENEYVRRKSISNSTIQASFEGTPAEYLTNNMVGNDDDVATDLYFAYLNAPTVGKNLLGDTEYQRLQTMLKPGEQAIAVMSNGYYSFVGEDFIPASVPDRLTLQQNDLPIEIRDINFYDDHELTSPYLQPFSQVKIFRISPQATFDPASEWQLSLLINRSRGQYFETITARFTEPYQLPKDFFIYPEIKETTFKAPWVIIWENRVVDIAILSVSLVLLTAIVVYQHRLTKNIQLFRWIRGGFLVFTLVFIGWYAQGQLSIVNIFPIIQSFFTGFRITDYLVDPMLFILWSYVFISLILWGRGIFCGWLCPFGALQEILSWLAKKLSIRQIHVAHPLHTKLWLIKYIVLVVLAGASIFSLYAAEIMSEVEPFKTSITLFFVRSWPFVLYSVVLLGLGLFIHKFYCRYVCPLGAGLAVIGFFRRFEWLERRVECGTPCQLCRKKCEIDAIRPSGEIEYNECIQCFECIVYYNNDELCAPKLVANKKSRKKIPSVNDSEIIASTQYYVPSP